MPKVSLDYYKKIKSLAIPFLTLVFLLALGVVGLEARRRLPLPTEAMIVIDFGDGKRRVFASEVIPQMNARVVLAAVAQSSGLKFAFDPQSGQINSVEDFEGGWMLEKNGKAVSESVAKITVSKGDRLVLKRLSP